MNKRVNLIQKIFNEFDGKNLNLLNDFYSQDIVFQDPLHKVEGFSSLQNYYAKIYKNVQSIRFDFQKFVSQDDEVVGFWTMSLKAKGLNQGALFEVQGVSVFIFNSENKVKYHRDYLDLGEMVYEKIFGLGFVIKKIKTLLK